MSDIDGLLSHCYDLLLQQAVRKDAETSEPDDELCACARLVERSEA